jgi:hypothetical protein
MAYFAAALAFLATALALLGFGFGTSVDGIGSPDTLVVVHLVTVGWLGLLFCGALLQFVPVLAATRLRLAGLALPALLAISSGLMMLEIGFLILGDHLDGDPMIMPIGGSLLALGFSLVATPVAATLVSKGSFGSSGMLVLLGLCSLAVTAIMGTLFSCLLSGTASAPSWAVHLDDMVPLHAASGLLGWMTLTAIGVSYRLFAMFMLSPESGASGKTVARLAAVALVALWAALAAVAAGSASADAGLVPALAAALGAAALYCRDIWHMFKARRRRALELNTVAGLASLGFLVAGLAALSLTLVPGAGHRLGAAGFYLLALGWLSGLGLAQLYKIVPFLTWLEAYGAVMGKHQVPKVQDLVDERRARIWYVSFHIAVAAGAGALILDANAAFRVASWCQCAAVAGLSVEYFRARRLAYAPDQLRLPPGTVRPHLVYAKTNHKE